jgi:hypothetical protein
MIREPAQRPDADQFGWIATLDSSGVGLVVALPVLGLFDAEGRIDADAGTFTVQERTIDTETLASVRPHRFGSVTVCRLSYVDGAGGVGRPYLFAVGAYYVA